MLDPDPESTNPDPKHLDPGDTVPSEDVKKKLACDLPLNTVSNFLLEPDAYRQCYELYRYE